MKRLGAASARVSSRTSLVPIVSAVKARPQSRVATPVRSARRDACGVVVISIARCRGYDVSRSADMGEWLALRLIPVREYGRHAPAVTIRARAQPTTERTDPLGQAGQPGAAAAP